MFARMTGDAAAIRPTHGGADISALAVWIACGVLYAVLMAMVFLAPGLLAGPGPGTELGFAEQGQNLTLFIALLLAIWTLVRANTTPLRAWLGLIVFGLVYLLGEETSWGQHYFGWSTGGIFERINDQGETNFHNTEGGWLDQKPRAILLLGMILGTIVHPLVRWARKGRGLFDNPWWLAPTFASLPPVVFSQLAALPKHIDKLNIFPYGLNLARWSELEELFIYIFFITYLLSLLTRLQPSKRVAA
jgi:hypothetical protein